MLTIGENIAYWRVKRGLTQQALARRVKVPQPNLSNLEQGKTDVMVSTLRKIASALEVPAGALMEGPSPPETTQEKWSTRETLERIAKAVISPAVPLNPRERRWVGHFRLLLPQGRYRYLSQKQIQRAWIELRSEISPQAIAAILSRIKKAKARRGLR